MWSLSGQAEFVQDCFLLQWQCEASADEDTQSSWPIFQQLTNFCWPTFQQLTNICWPMFMQLTSFSPADQYFNSWPTFQQLTSFCWPMQPASGTLNMPTHQWNRRWKRILNFNTGSGTIALHNCSTKKEATHASTSYFCFLTVTVVVLSQFKKKYLYLYPERLHVQCSCRCEIAGGS